MTNGTYFFDSYAIIELIKGNPNYKTYSLSTVITTKLNLFEVYYSLLRDFNQELADSFLEKYIDSVVDFDAEIIKVAAAFKLANKKQDLSMTDCIGYEIAKTFQTPFLTGDSKFENLENVEFVK